MKKQRLIELAVKVIVAALTAFLTALGTTSCMGEICEIFCLQKSICEICEICVTKQKRRLVYEEAESD